MFRIYAFGLNAADYHYLHLSHLVIALVKIPERERSISPSSIHGQLPNYESQVFSLFYPVDKFSFSEMRMWDQFKITSYCFCVWCESREIGGRGSSTFPCVTQVLETSTLDRATLRILPNNNNEVPLQKQAMVLTR